jgi:dTDP-4-amino-4,6-dideoxygalactose transaminase
MYSAGNLTLHSWWKLTGLKPLNDKLANRIHYSGFFLPNNQEMNNEDVDFICDIVINCLKEKD